MKRAVIIAVVVLIIAACATSPTGRRQLQLFPAQQMDSMGVQAYQEMRDQAPTLQSGESVGYVQCITDALVAVVPERYARDGDWEVTVFRGDEVNAFALPGGKIGVYTGLMRVAETPDQLAAVIGHEIGHVMAEHGNERLSTQAAASAGMAMAAVIAGTDGPEKQAALGLLGLGTQVGLILPFSRTHEAEADRIGLELMADAGFDPRESVALWRNMAASAGGDRPPEFLSTHPAEETRIERLQARMSEAVARFERARFDGREPDCRQPSSIPAGD